MVAVTFVLPGFEVMVSRPPASSTRAFMLRRPVPRERPPVMQFGSNPMPLSHTVSRTAHLSLASAMNDYGLALELVFIIILRNAFPAKINLVKFLLSF